MRRLLLLSTVLAASACTTSEPSTDTGQLTKIRDQVFVDCVSTADSTCTVEVIVSDGRLEAFGVTDEGATAGPHATADLTAQARATLADLVASIPTEASVVHDVGCGGAPLRTTSADVAFDHDGMRHFEIEYAAEGPMADFSRYLQDLVSGIRTCNSSELTFDSCTPNVF